MKRAALLPALALLAAATGRAEAAPAQESEHVVESGETLNGIANRAGVARSKIIEANGLEPPFLIKVGQKLKIPRERQAAADTGPLSPDMEIEHVVEEGETLGGIAHRAQVPRVLIAEANGLAPPYLIKVGQKLKIPRTRHHVVEEGETGFAISYTYAVPWTDIAVANGIDPDAAIRPGQKLLIPTMIDRPAPAAPAPAPAATPTPAPSPAAVAASRFAWPLSGSIRRGFAPRSQSDFHDGLDIQAPRGTAVRATAAGEVIFAGDKGDYGKLVIVSHGEGWHSVYGFLGRITVKKGEKLNKGERLGLVGSTGLAKGDELHFEMRRSNTPVDPRTELPEGP